MGRGIDYQPRLSRVVEKLKAARAERLECFGSERHRFELNPPLKEAEAAAFEAKHRIQLPEDYRAFLVLCGNGGAGPYYGINSLGQWQGWFVEEAEADDFLARPCPMVDADAIRSDGAGRLPASWSEWGFGSLSICDQGCTYEARLIVNGASRERIVYLDAQAAERFRPYFVRDLNFLDWYERWLDTVLAREPIFWFGMDNAAP